MTILVSGGAGFIGGNFVLDWLAQSNERVLNLDKLTYAGNLQTLASVQDDPRHVFAGGCGLYCYAAKTPRADGGLPLTNCADAGLD
jgi:nucleoside-diphosphate-sugar epimerase